MEKEVSIDFLNTVSVYFIHLFSFEQQLKQKQI